MRGCLRRVSLRLWQCLSIITVPYALNALCWFLFYPFYPKDVEARQARAAQASAQVVT